jgi:hypothetical protein
MASSRSKSRREDKQRKQLVKDLYFLIQWTEDADEELFDAVPARDITAPSGKDVLDLIAGDECQASFANTLYPARVVAVGE